MCPGVIMTVISTGSHHLYTPIWRDRMSSAADGCRGSPAPPAGGDGRARAWRRRGEPRCARAAACPSRRGVLGGQHPTCSLDRCDICIIEAEGEVDEDGEPLRDQRWRDKHWGEFGPISEADIARAPPPGDSPVRHAHEDDERLIRRPRAPRRRGAPRPRVGRGLTAALGPTSGEPPALTGVSSCNSLAENRAQKGPAVLR